MQEGSVLNTNGQHLRITRPLTLEIPFSVAWEPGEPRTWAIDATTATTKARSEIHPLAVPYRPVAPFFACPDGWGLISGVVTAWNGLVASVTGLLGISERLADFSALKTPWARSWWAMPELAADGQYGVLQTIGMWNVNRMDMIEYGNSSQPGSSLTGGLGEWQRVFGAARMFYAAKRWMSGSTTHQLCFWWFVSIFACFMLVITTY